jgi:hypothetical protein
MNSGTLEKDLTQLYLVVNEFVNGSAGDLIGQLSFLFFIGCFCTVWGFLSIILTIFRLILTIFKLIINIIKFGSWIVMELLHILCYCIEFSSKKLFNNTNDKKLN